MNYEIKNKKKEELKEQDKILNAIDVYIGKRIRIRRSLLGLSQHELAENLNISFQQIQKYEKGCNRISGSRIWQMARALNVPINYFFEGIDHNLILSGFTIPQYAHDCFYDSADDYNILKQPYEKQSALRDLVDSFTQINNSEIENGLLNLIKNLSIQQAERQKNKAPEKGKAPISKKKKVNKNK